MSEATPRLHYFLFNRGGGAHRNTFVEKEREEEEEDALEENRNGRIVTFPQQFAGTHLDSWVERITLNTIGSPARARAWTARLRCRAERTHR